MGLEVSNLDLVALFGGSGLRSTFNLELSEMKARAHCRLTGVAIIPALFIRISRRFDSDVIFFAANEMELKEARSRCRKLILASGTAALISATAASPLAMDISESALP